MAKLELRTVEGITLELEVAGPGTRFLAGLLDALLLGVLLTGVLLVLTSIAGVDPTGASTFVRGFLVMSSVLLVVVYFVLFHTLAEGRTPGKTAMGIRVLSQDGQPPSLGASILRGVLMIPDGLPVPLFVGVVVIALSPHRQRLGDMMAGTLVVRDSDPATGGLEPWKRETWTDLQVRVLDLNPAAVARFDLGDLDLLRAVITRRGMEPMLRRSLLGRIAAHYQARLGQERTEDPRAVLRELYLFLREHRAALREA